MKLNRYPFLERALRLQSQAATGLLHFSMREGNSIQVYFHDGLIDSASSSIASYQLGRYLIKSGVLNEKTLEKHLAKSGGRKSPLGKWLIEKEVLDAPFLGQLLTDQTTDLFRVAIEKDAQVKNFEKTVKDFDVRLRLPVEGVVLQILRTHDDILYLGPTNRVILNEDKRLAKLPWEPSEISVLSRLHIPLSLNDLAKKTGLEEDEIGKILNVLEKLDLIRVLNGQPSQSTSLIKSERLPLELVIPEIPNPHLNKKIEVLDNSNSFISEQFKSIKVNLSQLNTEKPVKVINITSPQLEDGKSLVATNLAFCFAEDPGRRVAIVDCDLRNPTLDTNLGIAPEPGLIDYLLDTRLEPQCYIRRVGDLFVITTGGIAENPISFLSLSKMENLINFLKEEFDTVILDSPPLSPIADAKITSKLGDADLLVVRQGRTPYSAIEKAKRVLNPKKFAGVVFNAVKPVPFSTYYPYEYYSYPSESVYAEAYEVDRAPSRRSLRKLKG